MTPQLSLLNSLEPDDLFLWASICIDRLRVKAASDGGALHAANILVHSAAVACGAIERLFYSDKGRALLAEVARQREDFPALCRVVKSKGEVSPNEEMIAALPIGEARGRWRRNKLDQLHKDLRLFWVGQLEAIRAGNSYVLEPEGEDIGRSLAIRKVAEAARKLPQRKGHESEWARVIVRLMEAQGDPILDPVRWPYKVANPMRVLARRQSRDLKALKAKKGTLTEAAYLHREARIKARKPTDNDVRNGLREAITARLEAM